MYGGSGNDSIVGGSGSYYNSGDNHYSGDQFLNGESGEDEIWGGDKKQYQQITGGSGNDWIWTGNDIGAEHLWEVDGKSSLIVSGDRGLDGGEINDSDNGSVDGDDVIDIGKNIFRAIAYGNGGNDKIFGNDGLDFPGQTGGAEYLYGGSGDDKLWAQHPGAVTDQNQNQYMFGGSGNDWLSGSNQVDFVWGDQRVANEDTDGIDWILGRGGDDYLFGGFGDDYIDGGDGDDWIEGGAGGNVMHGGAGDDYFISGGDDDWADGGPGNNSFRGGWGSNT